MNSCVPLAGNLLLKNIQNGFTKNLLLSPLSLNAIAAMVAAGCSRPSQERVLSFLGSKSLDNLKSEYSGLMSNIATSSCDQRDTRNVGNPKISFANGFWVNKRFPLKPSYCQRVSEKR
ncbi:hypothetical protein ACH5RR_018894 [Cinchona calisaya]|uniref:Serpin domain-containing protein n=1 Tax=Cinchona calisaya TaxID=153742 RepID=A0ABD2ZMS2_9GENT